MGMVRGVVATFAVAVLGSVGAGCSSDIFDLEVALDAQSYAFDFGKAQGTIPTITCDPAAPSVCGSAPPIAVDPALGVPANVWTSGIAILLGIDHRAAGPAPPGARAFGVPAGAGARGRGRRERVRVRRRA